MSQLTFDLMLTVGASFSLVGLLSLAAMLLPWREAELQEIEDALWAMAAPAVPVIVPVDPRRRAA